MVVDANLVAAGLSLYAGSSALSNSRRVICWLCILSAVLNLAFGLSKYIPA